ncbi:MAG: hypothetical protein LBD12_07400 [Clostridiales Family XIII bacterium]|nr:hypothetical protein [Clostridiales Family XIII bacterium]
MRRTAKFVTALLVAVLIAASAISAFAIDASGLGGEDKDLRRCAKHRCNVD